MVKGFPLHDPFVFGKNYLLQHFGSGAKGAKLICERRSFLLTGHFVNKEVDIPVQFGRLFFQEPGCLVDMY